jgi:hypothetical protein
MELKILISLILTGIIYGVVNNIKDKKLVKKINSKAAQVYYHLGLITRRLIREKEFNFYDRDRQELKALLYERLEECKIAQNVKDIYIKTVDSEVIRKRQKFSA